MRAAIAGFVLALLVAAAAGADERTSPEAVVGRFHAALASGERQAVLDLLHPHVVVFESGEAEPSREVYASHHLGADIAIATRTDAKLVEQRKGGSEDTAWVIGRYEITGTYDGKPVALDSTETMVLTRTPQGWKIVHIHWSSQPRESSSR